MGFFEPAPNLAVGPGESVYVMAVDDVNNAPWPDKLYPLLTSRLPETKKA